jgi:ketosteroid isomerase-like protein
MKRLLSLLILAFLGSLLILGQASAQKDQSGSAEQEITRIRRDWYNAFFRGDTATMNRIETDNFVVVSDRGSRNKRQQLAGIQKKVQEDKWMPKGVTLVDENLNMRLHGDTAVLSGLGWNKQPGQGNKHPKSKNAFTEVWIKRDGRWQVMHLHYNPLDQASSPQPSRR